MQKKLLELYPNQCQGMLEHSTAQLSDICLASCREDLDISLQGLPASGLEFWTLKPLIHQASGASGWSVISHQDHKQGSCAGYDNMEVNMDPVVDYINNANQSNLRREQDARRTQALTKTPDPRVDVCVYFIA